jgi:hypothetical protein
MNRKTILPRPPRAFRKVDDYEEADLDELCRTSLNSSLQELIERHLDDEAQRVRAAEAERQARALSLAQRREREALLEATRLKAAEQATRLKSLRRRESLARKEGALAAAPLVERIVTEARARRRQQSQTAALERAVAQGQLETRKRGLRRILQAAVVVGALGALSFVHVAEGVHNQQEQTLSSLRDQAQLLESRAQEKLEALQAQLTQQQTLSQDERRALRKAVAAAEEEAETARAETVRLAEAQSKERNRALSRPLRAGSIIADGKKELAIINPSPAPVARPAATCLEGDPLCWDL